MTKPSILLERLDEIAAVLAATGDALAILSFGSAGTALARLDEYADLDFFVVVKPGAKARFVTNLEWLESIAPLGFAFRNTVDGYKLLFEDGVFCEIAVFEEQDLANTTYPVPRVVWAAEVFEKKNLTPKISRARDDLETTMDWMLGEALTNLYVGLMRFHRGEKLSGMQFVQVYAVSRILELAALVEDPQPGEADLFSAERRFEARFPRVAAQLPAFTPGYDKTPQAARAILAWLETHFLVNARMREEILKFL